LDWDLKIGLMKKVFINYSNDPEDKKLFSDLYMHLGLIHEFDIWHSGKINAGAVTDQELNTHLDESEVVIALLSIDYLSDTECMNRFASAKAQQKKLYPVLIRPFDIDCCDALKDLNSEVIPENKTFIDTASNIDQACMEVCIELRSKVLGAKYASPIFNINSRRFLWMLFLVPLILALAYLTWCILNRQLSSITFFGCVLMIIISLIPAIKLFLPTNPFHKYA
jgi:hypothetical protein